MTYLLDAEVKYIYDYLSEISEEGLEGDES